jgi:hypothetical protein
MLPPQGARSMSMPAPIWSASTSTFPGIPKTGISRSATIPERRPIGEAPCLSAVVPGIWDGGGKVAPAQIVSHPRHTKDLLVSEVCYARWDRITVVGRHFQGDFVLGPPGLKPWANLFCHFMADMLHAKNRRYGPLASAHRYSNSNQRFVFRNQIPGNSRILSPWTSSASSANSVFTLFPWTTQLNCVDAQ